MTESTKSENERQYEVIDQMLTMHSSFRDRMERRAFWLNTGLIGSSLFLLIFSFVGDDLLRALRFNPTMARFILGLVSGVVLLFSITEFRVDWRSVAGRHSDAVLRLAALKSKFRKLYVDTGGTDTKRNARLTAEYNKVLSTLPVIPDRWFITLKAEHRLKRLLSERISLFPKAPIWYLRLQLRLEGIRESRRGAEERRDDRRIEGQTC